MKPTLTHEAYAAVREFNFKNNLKVYPHGNTREVRLFRQRMILEELGEVAIAVHEWDPDPSFDNLVKVADGLADLLYVVVGTWVMLLPPEMPDPWEVSTEGIRPFSPEEALNQLTGGTSLVLDGLTYVEASKGLRATLPSLAGSIQLVATLTFRLPLRACFMEVHRSNMTKILGDVSDGRKGNSGKPYKGEGYRPPNLQGVLWQQRAKAAGASK